MRAPFFLKEDIMLLLEAISYSISMEFITVCI